MAIKDEIFINPDIGGEAGNSGSEYIEITYSGTPTQIEYDVYSPYVNKHASMYFHRKGLGDITVKNISSTNITINSIKVSLGSKTFCTITLSSGVTLTAGSTKSYPLDSYSFDFDITREDENFTGCDVSSSGVVREYKDDIYFDAAGTYAITSEVAYTKSGTNIVHKRTSNIYVTFSNPTLQSISLDTSNVQREFELHEPYNYTGLVVYAHYKCKIGGQVLPSERITSYSIASSPNTHSEGTKWAVVYYGSKSTQYSITVGATLSKTLSVDFNNIPSQVYVDDVIYLSTISGTFTIDTKIASEYDEYPIINNVTNDLQFRLNAKPVDERNIQLDTLGTHYLIASYTYEDIEYTATKEITVLPAEIESFSVSTNPTKSISDYVEGQVLDLSGLTFGITYNVENKAETNLSYLSSRIALYLGGEEITSKANYTLGKNDNNKILSAKLIDSGHTVEIGTVTVTSKQLVQISIQKNPDKTTYTYGDKFSLKGISVKATFNNNDFIFLSENALTSEFKDKVFTRTDFSTPGYTMLPSVSYTYDGITKSVSFPITCTFPTFDKIEVDTTNYRTSYEDWDVFYDEGLKVYAVYKNGYKEEALTYETNASEVLNLDVDNKIRCEGNYGIKEITITAIDPFSAAITSSTTYDITVESATLVRQAYLDVLDSDLTYYVGDKFDAHGVKFVIQDADGNTYNSKNFTTNPTIGTIFKSAKVYPIEFTYIKDDYIKTQTLNIKVSVKDKPSYTEVNDYSIAIGDELGNLFDSLTVNETEIKLGLQGDGSCIYPIFNTNKITIDTNSEHENTYGYNVYVSGDIEKDCIGYMDLGLQDEYGNIYRNAHVVFFEDVANPIEGDGNITVKLPHYVEGHSERINKCKFGKIFNKRLFVSGNENYKNCDWHSEDLTYFSDLNYCRYGSDETAVVGYDIYRDGDLIVFKESSRNEATLYRRSSTLIAATDYAGNKIRTQDQSESLYEEAYSCFDINNNGGEGSFTNRTIINFIGDTLFLTRNGLKVLSSKETTMNNAKYTYDVSSYINPKITNEELENAHLYTFKERLILTTKRGVYFGEYNLRNEKNEYEWYFLDNIKATLFFEYDNELYFADNEGNINKFNDVVSSYVDKRRIYIGVGGAYLTNIENDGDGFSIDENENVIILNSAYNDEIVEGRDFHLIHTYNNQGVDNTCLIHASLGNFINENTRQHIINNGETIDHSDWLGLINATDNTITIKPYINDTEPDDDRMYKYMDLFYDGRVIYLDKIVGGVVNVSIDKPYTLKQYVSQDPFYYSYQLVDEYGNTVDLLGIESFRVSFIATDILTTKIAEVSIDDNGIKTFKLLGDHNMLLDLIHYNNRNDRYSAIITDKQNVQAYYRTKPYNMGTTMYEKTIWSWTVVNDSGVASSTDVGYITSRKQKGFELVMDSNEFDVTGFDFSNVQFTNNEAPYVFLKNKILANITFVEFVFKNDKDSNMVLSQLSVLYSISQTTRGVK